MSVTTKPARAAACPCSAPAVPALALLVALAAAVLALDMAEEIDRATDDEAAEAEREIEEAAEASERDMEEAAEESERDMEAAADVALDRLADEAEEADMEELAEAEDDTAAHSADWSAWAVCTSVAVQFVWRQERADCWKAVEPQTQVRSSKLAHPFADAAFCMQVRMQGSMPAVLDGVAADAELLCAPTPATKAVARTKAKGARVLEYIALSYWKDEIWQEDRSRGKQCVQVSGKEGCRRGFI